MKIGFFGCLLWMSCVLGYSQGYEFSHTQQNYVPLVDAHSVTNGMIWLDVDATIPIGFTFHIAQHAVQELSLPEYGGPIVQIFGLGTSTNAAMLTAFGALVADRNATMENIGEAGGISHIYYKTEGMIGSRIFTLEYRNVGLFVERLINGTNDLFANFQVKLFEGSNRIEYHYGPSNVPAFHQVFLGEAGPAVVVVPHYDVTNIDSPVFISGQHLTGAAANPSFVPILDEDDLYTGLVGVPANGKLYRFVNTLSTNDLTGDNQWSIFPNPTKDVLQHNLPLDDIVSMQIFDTNGKLVYKAAPVQQLEIGRLEAGVYFLVIELKNGERLSKKFVKA